MSVLIVGINHRTAPVEVREHLFFSTRSLVEALAGVCSVPGIGGSVILFTCNRTEIYAVARELDGSLPALKDYLSRLAGIDGAEIKKYTYAYTFRDCVRHLFRVSAGLDSMLPGEPQILGQVRDAYQFACARGFTNKILNVLFQQAIAVGKRVRKATGIDQNAISIGYAAVELARRTLGDFAGCSVLIVGAGKISELVVRYLVDNGITGVVVSNRSPERAVTLARQFGGRAVGFDQLEDYLLNAQIVISCTAATHYVLHYAAVAQVMAKRPETRLLLIDLAVPRDIDPQCGTLPGIALYNIDDLQNVVEQNLAWRKQAAAAAEVILEEELNRFMKWLATQSVVPTITALLQRAEQIKQDELQRALKRLGDLSAHDKKVISALANSIVNRLLHTPVTRLKDHAQTSGGNLYPEVLQDLFNLGAPGEQVKEESRRLALDNRNPG